MPKSHCITHPARAEMVIIREDYLALCDKNHCAAAILNVFEYWNDIKLGQSEQAATENEIANAGNVSTVEASLWVYKSIPELSKELMGLFGVSKIGKALDILKLKGFIDSRNNPKYGWDRTLQYEFQTETIQKAIQALKITHGSLKKKVSKASKTTDRSLKNKAAIPETTTETTTKKSSPRKRDGYFDAIALVFKTDAGGYIGNIKSMMLGIAKRGEWKRCNFDPPVQDPAEIIDFGVYMQKRMAEKGITEISACVTIQRWFYDFRDECVREAARKITQLNNPTDLTKWGSPDPFAFLESEVV